MFNAFNEIQPAFSENRLEKQGITLKDLLDVSLSLDTSKRVKTPYYLTLIIQILFLRTLHAVGDLKSIISKQVSHFQIGTRIL